MEWMLQVADEFDDALGVMRHSCHGVVAEVGALILAGLGIGVDVAGPSLGAQPVLLGAAAIVANLAALLKIRSSRPAARL
jgi:hypothetical protein